MAQRALDGGRLERVGVENGEKPGENPKKMRKTIENLGKPQEKNNFK